LSNISESIKSCFQFTWIDHHAIISLLYIAVLSPPGISNGVVILGPPVKIGLISAVWITLNACAICTESDSYEITLAIQRKFRHPCNSKDIPWKPFTCCCH
jgi:hypothetical protein